MHNRIDADSQEITRVNSEHAEIFRILKRRQRFTGRPYGPVAGALGAAATFIWGSILRDARTNPQLVPSRAYLAWLAFAIVIGFSAAVAAILWCSVVNTRKLAADGDRINEYRLNQQVREIRDQVLAGIRDQEQSERRQRWERWMAGTGTEPRPDPRADPRADPRPAGGQVMPFDRPRPAGRNS